MTYEEHFKFFFKSNPGGYTRNIIELTRDTKPMVMYVDDTGKIQQTISNRSWRDISLEEAELLLKNNMKLMDLRDKLNTQLEEISKDFK